MTSGIEMPERSGQLAAGAPRIVPERTRHDWEAEWLKQNREAVRTLESPGRAPAGSARERPLPPPAAATVRGEQAAPLRWRTAADDTVATAAAAPSLSSPTPWRNLYRPDAAGLPHAVPQPLPTRATAADAAPEPPLAAPPERRAAPAAPPKRFGFWRDGDAITLSLRTDANQPAPPLAALRRWLRGLGLTLRAVIVNGVEHEQPSQHSNPVLANRQETTPWQ